MKRLSLLWVSLLLTATGFAQSPPAQLHLLVTSHEVVYVYPDNAPEQLYARLLGDETLVETCQQLAGIRPDFQVFIKGFPDTPYDQLSWLLTRLREAGLGNQVTLAHISNADMAVLASVPKLPTPPDPKTPDTVVWAIASNDRMCFYLKEWFPNTECFLFDTDRIKSIIQEHEGRVHDLVIDQSAGLTHTKRTMALFQALDIALNEVRHPTPAERSALQLPPLPQETAPITPPSED